jgi:two-component sensor histidine kinase
MYDFIPFPSAHTVFPNQDFDNDAATYIVAERRPFNPGAQAEWVDAIQETCMQMTPLAWRRDEFVLIRELTHRHFNGLQVIASAISRCGREPTLAQTQARLADLEERIAAHASLHRLLSDAPLPGLLETHCLALCFNLLRIFAREDVTPYVQIDGVELSAVQAFLTSLLVAELVTNALKHSLAQEDGGTIWIDMRCVQQCEVELTVCDSSASSLGERAIHQPRIATALAQILSGRIDVLRDDGYVTRVRFPLDTKRDGDLSAR